MSQIKKLATKIKTLDSLVKALKEAGIPENAIEVDTTKMNRLPLEDYYRNTRQNELTVRIRKSVTGGYEDAGFRFANGVFEAVVSTHDRKGMDFGQEALKQVIGLYAVNEAKRLARLNGYTIGDTVQNGKTVQFVCNYSGY
jgi:hypothetical protein